MSVEPKAFMTMNVPINETGIARAAMNVVRRVAQEEKHHEAGQQASENQMVLDVVDRAADEYRLILRTAILMSGGKCLFDLFQACHYLIGHGHGVCAGLLA